MTYQIKSPYFVAGLIVDKDTKLVLNAAPIIKYMRGWSLNKVESYANKKRWSIERVTGD